MYYLALIAIAVLSFFITRFIVKHRSAAVVYGSEVTALMISILVFAFLFVRNIGSLYSIEHWHLVRFVYDSGLFVAPIVFLFVFAICVLLISKKPSRKYSPIVPTILIWMALSLPFTGLYAKKIEPYWIETTTHTITTDKLEKNGIRIVQLSDIHLDEFGKREKKTLEILKQLDPDVILLTGDYLNNSKKQKEINHFMKSLSAKEGIYAVKGNWEGTSKIIKYFEGTDIQLIDNQTRNITINDETISITGVHWILSRNNMPVHIKPITEDKTYNVVLCHYPDISLKPPKWADLILSGHTHGGQVRLPFVGPLVTFSRVSRDNAAGMSEMPNGGKLYVNRGLGMEGGPSPRIRFLCRPEITVFDLKPE